jgi:hypothetical protein
MAHYPGHRHSILGLALIVAIVISLYGRSWTEASSHATAGSKIQAAPVTAGATLIRSDAQGVQIQLEVPQYTVDSMGAVAAPGLTHVIREAGAPALPYYSTFIVLPPEADVDVTVRGQSGARKTVASVSPAPQPVIEPEDELSLHNHNGVNTEYKRNPAIYSADEPYPNNSYRLSEPMYYRDLRLVRLELFPLRYNPARQMMEHATEMVVTLSFSGARLDQLRPAGGSSAATDSVIAPYILNYEAGQAWRSLPAGQEAATAALPLGKETFKIEVNEDGIYEIEPQDLEAAGMNVGSANPEQFEMMYRGEPVAYQLVNNNSNGAFDANEKIRFYGWAFNGPRTEKQFITNNVYWLWAAGSPTHITSTPSDTSAPLAESYTASVTHEPDLVYYDTLSTDWASAPNEPDAWYWEYYDKPIGDPYLRTASITLSAPATTVENSPATLTVEFTNHERSEQRNQQLLHDVDIYLNNNTDYVGSASWTDIRNVNVTTTVPITLLNNGTNTVNMQFNDENTLAQSRYFLNGIRVDYERLFVAEDEQLIFDDGGAPSSYRVEGFSNGNAGEVAVWEISDRQKPVVLTGVQVGGTGPYSYHFGTGTTDNTFIATHAGNLKAPETIEKYVPVNLDPPDGAAEWVAIAYGDLIPALGPLTAHRANPEFGGFDTHVIDVEDVINQYGFGLPLPAAIHDYLAHALQTWSLAPRYVTLVGDATVDPRQICHNNPSDICTQAGIGGEINYVPTDLLFNDRRRAHVVSDYTYALLAGDDLIPDVAVGRIAVHTTGELNNVVEKIIGYETQRLTPEPWHTQAVFIADNPDTAGNFCLANQAVGEHLPSSWSQNHLCLPHDSDDAINAMRTAILNAISGTGATFVNYRGHGSIQEWAHQLGGSTAEEDGLDGWYNFDKPVIILSMDCHDGNFSRPNHLSFAEGLLKLERSGTVAHWSSTGLGWDFEHDVLHRAFYDGIFDNGLARIGDAIDYSKIAYEQSGFHDSQLYSFVLHGDPAMQTVHGIIPGTFDVYLPTLQSD